MIELFKYPVLTEKSTRLIESDQYTFDLDTKLTKTQIKVLIENIFGVKSEFSEYPSSTSQNTSRWSSKRIKKFSKASYYHFKSW